METPSTDDAEQTAARLRAARNSPAPAVGPGREQPLAGAGGAGHATLVIGAFDVAGLVVHPRSGVLDGTWVPLREGAADHLDYQTVAELCRSCAVELLESGSRWSVWFCNECKDRVRDLDDRVGTCVIPIGRHSLMNGVGLRSDLARDDTQLAAFAENLQRFVSATTRVDEWAVEIVRRNCAQVGMAHRDAVPIGEYLEAVSELDREAAFEDMKVWWLSS